MNTRIKRHYATSKPVTHNTSNEKLLNTIFNDLSKFIETNPLNVETQESIERFLKDQYADWVSNKKVSNILGVNMSSNIFTPKLNDILLHKISIMESYINKARGNEITEPTSDIFTPNNCYYHLNLIIRKLDNKIITSLIMYYFFKISTSRNTEYDDTNTLTTTISFGKDIIREYLITLYKDYLKTGEEISFSMWKNLNSDVVKIYTDNNILYSYIGAKLLVELLSICDLMYNDIIVNRKDKQSVLKINNEVAKLLTTDKIYVLPLRLPMIVEPKKYAPKVLGGYLLNDVEISNEIIIPRSNYKQATTILDKNIIYHTANNNSNTPYKVNTDVLEFVLEYGIESGLIGDVNKDHEFEYITRNKRQERIYRSDKSKLLLEQNIISIASTYSNVPNLYFPVRLDNRGRMYCEPNYFNYQSSELAKSLILFSRPGIIARDNYIAIDYLKAYGANCYGQGLDKKSYVKRIQWLDSNINNILNYKNGVLLSKAKSKCLFLAFCIEYARFNDFIHQKDVLEFKTCLPIQLDATCNGFQHLALLSKETKIYPELNLSKSNNNTEPKDFYTYIINKLSITFKEKNSSILLSDELKESYARLNNVLWDRSNIKHAIMTIPYNAKLLSITECIKDTLKRCEPTKEELEIISENINMNKINLKTSKTKGKNDKTQELIKIDSWYGLATQAVPKRLVTNRDIILLAKTICSIIENDFPKINKLRKYLLNIATVCNKLQIPIGWSLPSGLLIDQSYLSTTVVKIKPFTYSKSSLTLRVANKDKFDTPKQKTSLMPNIIHSLDAASLALLYNSFYSAHKPVVNFYSVHDCFSTTADKVDSLINLLKAVYTKVYIEDTYLRKFDKGIIDSIKYYYAEGCIYDEKLRIFTIDGTEYRLLDIEQVLGKKLSSKNQLKDSRYLII